MEVTEELKNKVYEYVQKKKKVKSREIAEALNVQKSLVDKAVSILVDEGKLSFYYNGASYVVTVEYAKELEKKEEAKP